MAVNSEDLVDPSVFIGKEILELHRIIEEESKVDHENAFSGLWRGRKFMANIDHIAEEWFRRRLRRRFPELRIEGEESLARRESQVTFEGERNICVLMDMIDGTDLLKRRMDNWCSAVVVFNPVHKTIEAAYVAIAARWLYYANDRGAYKIYLRHVAGERDGRARRGSPGRAQSARQRHIRDEAALVIKPGPKQMLDAGVCMYGQRIGAFKNMLSLMRDRPDLRTWLVRADREDGHRKRRLDDKKPEVPFRFYNLAGNPMMVRMADGDFDVVVELNGQLPHDVVPGAFIAMKAGAVMGSPEERRLYTLRELCEALYTPAQRGMKYILASSEELYDDVFKVLSSKRTVRARPPRVATAN